MSAINLGHVPTQFFDKIPNEETSLI